MHDPIGLIGSGNIGRDPSPVRSPRPAEGGPAFKDVMAEQLRQVNDLQKSAEEAMEDLATGRRDDVETVMTAMLQADTAFRMLLQVRNKMMDAYEEVKQIRV